MTRRHTQLFITIAAGIFLLALMALATLSTPADHAQAGAVPTPIANTNPSQDQMLISFFDWAPVTATGNTPGIQIYNAEYCNAQWVTDHTVANSTTFKVQYSMDNTNWSEGPVLIAANAADDNAIVQFPVLSRYVRINYTVTNANPMTWTIKAVCK